MSALWRLLIPLALFSACSGDSDDETPIVFVDLEEGAVVGGLETTTVEADFSIGVIHIDLFLDGNRIGADDLAPFSFDWNTVDHDEGEAQLRASVTLEDGTTVDESIGVVIDNTRPVVSPLEEEIEVGDVVTIQAIDAHRIVHVEVTVSGEVALSLDAQPFRGTWDVACGAGDVVVTAIDEAGWEGTWSGPVQTSFPADRDCDGFESIDLGGPGRRPSSSPGP